MQVAIDQALMVLAWFENHPKEDTPPEHIWEDPDGLEEWWTRVKERQEIRASGGGRQGRGYDDDSDGDEFAGNELARALKE